MCCLSRSRLRQASCGRAGLHPGGGEGAFVAVPACLLCSNLLALVRYQPGVPLPLSPKVSGERTGFRRDLRRRSPDFPRRQTAARPAEPRPALGSGRWTRGSGRVTAASAAPRCPLPRAPALAAEGLHAPAVSLRAS